MKLGIRFSDNDFCTAARLFMQLYILPNFIEREKGHFITHLTSSQVVDMYNTYMPHLQMYLDEERYRENKYFRSPNDTDLQGYKSYLQIQEVDVYWDGKIDNYPERWGVGCSGILEWEGWNNAEFVWTDGKEIHIT